MEGENAGGSGGDPAAAAASAAAVAAAANAASAAAAIQGRNKGRRSSLILSSIHDSQSNTVLHIGMSEVTDVSECLNC